MMKTEHIVMAGAVGIAGIIGYSILMAKPEDERFAGFGIPSLGQIIPSFDLTGMFAGLRFPEVTIPEFPSLAGLIPKIPSLADITAPITEPIGNIFAGVTETIKEIGLTITKFPQEFGESIGAGFKATGKGFAEGIIAISPFGWGQAIGEALPVGTWLGSLFPPQAPAPFREPSIFTALKVAGATGGTREGVIIGGDLRNHPLNPFRGSSGGSAPVTGWLSEQVSKQAPAPISTPAPTSIIPPDYVFKPWSGISPFGGS